MKETQKDFGLIGSPVPRHEWDEHVDAAPLYIGLRRTEPTVRGEPWTYRGGVSVSSGAPADIAKSPVGLRFNNGKPMLTLIEPGFRLEMAKVLTRGAQKYARDNWKKGIPIQTGILDSLERHLVAFEGGQELDEETGCHHLAMVAVNAMFAWWLLKNKPEFDDRYKEPQK